MGTGGPCRDPDEAEDVVAENGGVSGQIQQENVLQLRLGMAQRDSEPKISFAAPRLVSASRMIR
jgi:hypothetical protein